MFIGSGFATIFLLGGPVTGSDETAFLGAMLIGAIAVWAVIDMFMIPSMAKKYNQQLAERLSEKDD